MPRPKLSEQDRAVTRGISLKPAVWKFADARSRTENISLSGWFQELVLAMMRREKEKFRKPSKKLA